MTENKTTKSKKPTKKLAIVTLGAIVILLVVVVALVSQKNLKISNTDAHSQEEFKLKWPKQKDIVDEQTIDNFHYCVALKSNKDNYLKIVSEDFLNAKISDFTSFKVNGDEYIDSGRVKINIYQGIFRIDDNYHSGELGAPISNYELNTYSFIFKNKEYKGEYKYDKEMVVCESCQEN